MKIDLDSFTNVLTVDGVMIHLELLKCLANPDPNKLYRIVRRGEQVSVEVINWGFDPGQEPKAKSQEPG